MSANFTNTELEAFLDEGLPVERMAAMESALRDSEELRQQLAALAERITAAPVPLSDIR
jgi:hypothetical protein